MLDIEKEMGKLYRKAVKNDALSLAQDILVTISEIRVLREANGGLAAAKAMDLTEKINKAT